jgi:lysophospholipase L1-like esterase
MKPLKSLLFLIVVFGILTLIAWATPKGGIKLFNDLKIKFPTLSSIFNDSTIKYADISSIIKKTELKSDSLQLNDSLLTIDSLNVDSLVTVIQQLEFPDSGRTALLPFFKNVQRNEGLIRVLHYGDSQIEGDRITSFIRNRFQGRFGGSGAGMVPIVEVNNLSGAISLDNTGEWKRYTLFGKIDKTIKHKKYGVMLSFSRFAPVYNDSISNDTIIYEASVKIQKASAAYGNCYNFSEIKLLYGNNKKPVMAELYDGDKLLGFETLLGGQDFNIATWKLTSVPKELTLKFSGKDSPDIYGIAFDSNKGLAFDNIPLRGSSGTDFSRGDLSLLKKMYEQLNVKLLIFEFGVNVVPNVQEDYTFYENWIYGQLSTLKRIHPDMGIIVIGISDMSQKTENGYESYPNIEKIRNAQKKAAFRANCAFWDFYQAMGGKNSMPSWVNADPPMAAKDYTHLSPRGAKITAEMLYNALVSEYNLYKTTHTETANNKAQTIKAKNK